jgi:hypothetical protein
VSRGRAVSIAAVVVAGGALAWWKLRAPPPRPDPIPAYDAAPPSLVLRDPSERFEVDLRPAAPITGQVIASSFVVHGAEVTPFKGGKTRKSPEGVVHLEGAAEILRGASALRVVVGRSNLQPDAASRASGTAIGGPGWQLVAVPIRWE